MRRGDGANDVFEQGMCSVVMRNESDIYRIIPVEIDDHILIYIPIYVNNDIIFECFRFPLFPRDHYELCIYSIP